MESKGRILPPEMYPDLKARTCTRSGTDAFLGTVRGLALGNCRIDAKGCYRSRFGIQRAVKGMFVSMVVLYDSVWARMLINRNP